jgi:apolipoprotein N-acyltransferase
MSIDELTVKAPLTTLLPKVWVSEVLGNYYYYFILFYFSKWTWWMQVRTNKSNLLFNIELHFFVFVIKAELLKIARLAE